MRKESRLKGRRGLNLVSGAVFLSLVASAGHSAQPGISVEDPRVWPRRLWKTSSVVVAVLITLRITAFFGKRKRQPAAPDPSSAGQVQNPALEESGTPDANDE